MSEVPKLSAAETIFQIRHHMQMALGELAKLAKANLVTTPARSVLTSRLHTAISLADTFEATPPVSPIRLAATPSEPSGNSR